MKPQLLLVLLLCCVVSDAEAQAPESDRTEQNTVLALENAWNQAVQQKDAAALDLLLGMELVYIDYDGTVMDKAEYLASVKAAAFHATRITNESVSAHSYGETILVYGVYRESGTLDSGKAYNRRERFTDLWARRKGSWLCVSSQSTSAQK
jgi:ketosteroid isomerase-like protein